MTRASRETGADGDDARVLPFVRSPETGGTRDTPGPLVGPPTRDRFYATRLRQLARLELEESKAETVWRAAAEHRNTLSRQLRRDVGFRVALFDYLVNIRPQFVEPQIIERNALDALERRAVVDPLTGIYNRHYFDSAFTQEIQRCRRYGACPSLLVLDVDRFKEINDRHGHDVGDMVLRRVGALIRALVRAVDIPCRPGGDEFAVILPDTGCADARVVGERIRGGLQRAVAASVVRGGPLVITVSGGIATATPRTATAERVFQDADRALYQAKRAGANRIGPCRKPCPPRPAPDR